MDWSIDYLDAQDVFEGNKTLNILHIVASPSPGGIETYIMDLSVELNATGHSTHIMFLEGASDAGTSQDYERWYLSSLDSFGIRYSFIGSNARRRPWRGIVRMRKYVRENGIEVYHSHLTYGAVFGALVHVPRIYTHHSIDMRVGRFTFSVTSRFIDQLVGISDGCANALSQHAGREVAVIFNAIDLKKFAGREIAAGKIRNAISCIAVGRICKEKNYELLVEALATLPDNVLSRLSVRIVGAGSQAMTDRLEKAIDEKKLENVVCLLGSRGDIPKLLASSQLFLMSSSSEGLPIALIEAAASGLPSVVTDVGGCREVIEKCHNGVVVEPNSARALSDAIGNIISDADQFAKYSANAVNYSKAFSIKTAAASHVELYRRLLLAGRK